LIDITHRDPISGISSRKGLKIESLQEMNRGHDMKSMLKISTSKADSQ